MHKWQLWHITIKEKMKDEKNYPPSNKEIIQNHWALNYPVVIELPNWPAFNWTLETLKQIDGIVQVQVNRNSNPNYEIQPYNHRGNLPFNQFIELLENGNDNDLYMTAQNQCCNGNILDKLYTDIYPLPPFLTNNQKSGFFWIGKNTITPLHHDLTNNFICQIMGTKLIRTIPPSEFEKIDYNCGVHSNISWLSDELIIAKKIKVYDYFLHPGDGLFLPVGWWHCVKAFDIAISVVYTNFIWPNNWHVNFNL